MVTTPWQNKAQHCTFWGLPFAMFSQTISIFRSFNSIDLMFLKGDGKVCYTCTFFNDNIWFLTCSPSPTPVRCLATRKASIAAWTARAISRQIKLKRRGIVLLPSTYLRLISLHNSQHGCHFCFCREGGDDIGMQGCCTDIEQLICCQLVLIKCWRVAIIDGLNHGRVIRDGLSLLDGWIEPMVDAWSIVSPSSSQPVKSATIISRFKIWTACLAADVRSTATLISESFMVS